MVPFFSDKLGQLNSISQPWDNKISIIWHCCLFPPEKILDSSKLKEFADDNFELDENGRKFSKWVENTG